jgi:hypothetical protein
MNYAMRMYEGIVEGGFLASGPGRFTPGKESEVPYA